MSSLRLRAGAVTAMSDKDNEFSSELIRLIWRLERRAGGRWVSGAGVAREGDGSGEFRPKSPKPLLPQLLRPLALDMGPVEGNNAAPCLAAISYGALGKHIALRDPDGLCAADLLGAVSQRARVRLQRTEKGMSMAATITKSSSKSRPQPGVSFLELYEGFCKRPLGAKTEPATRFCGKPTPAGSPYCLECQKIVYAAMARR